LIAGVEASIAGPAEGGPGVTELDRGDGRPVPMAFDAVTVNAYAVPFVSPVIVALVVGGDPVIVVEPCALEPMYGVTV
jgi:hypothetical protein